MYVLINDSNRPFAIVKDNTNMRIERAIAEEYSYEDVNIINKVKLPDWGETSVIDFMATNDDGFNYHDSVEIMKLVKY